jgi:hypothetical protein
VSVERDDFELIFAALRPRHPNGPSTMLFSLAGRLAFALPSTVSGVARPEPGIRRRGPVDMAHIADKFKGLRYLGAEIEVISRCCGSKSPANCAPALMGLQ